MHGLKSWVHLTSSDLVHWENLGEAVYPDTPLDSHGAYSGSAKAIGDKLFLMYTGNVRDENWVRHSYQVGAWMDEEGKATKLETPLINSPEHVTEHFRDPQILEHDGKYYAILGAQDKETKAGKISLYC
ncbi:beta-fructofuranosidase [Lactobacillus delbrueckii subsp. bulgaricus]|nr:beta-fructofuranosidase [Lactobacillus delbrueckii subsp. bulgaricus]MBT8935658.1 beta-fructofuranosidase [Lactobacillus delbrueckii subsp. bulgaricus]